MTSDKRRAKRVSVELPVKVSFFDNKKKTRTGDVLSGCISDFSPLGAALTVDTIQLSGKHLFYTCQDNPDIVLELAFEISGSPEETITVPAVPVWFDRDLDSEKKQFSVGLKFLTNTRSPEIKILSRLACRDETMLVSLWKKFFLLLNYPLFLASSFLFSGGTS